MKYTDEKGRVWKSTGAVDPRGSFLGWVNPRDGLKSVTAARQAELWRMESSIESVCSNIIDHDKDFNKDVRLTNHNTKPAGDAWHMSIDVPGESFEQCCKEVWSQIGKIKHLRNLDQVEKLYWRVRPTVSEEESPEGTVIRINMRFTFLSRVPLVNDTAKKRVAGWVTQIENILIDMHSTTNKSGLPILMDSSKMVAEFNSLVKQVTECANDDSSNALLIPRV